MHTICEFQPDRQRTHSGENLTGRIILKTSATKCVEKMYIAFVGQAEVYFEETRVCLESNDKEPERFVTTATETYTKYYKQIYGCDKLAKGTHTFTFSIPLPTYCPTSSSGKFGRVWYVLSLVIERTFRVNTIHSIPIDVLQPYDLSAEPKILRPIELMAMRKLWRWPFRPGIINLNLYIPSGGYTPGDRVNYAIDVHNKSKSVDIKGYTVSLVQEFEYFAGGHRRVCPLSVYSETKWERVKHLTKRSLSASFVIPSVPPSSQIETIIRVSYKLTLTVLLTGWHLTWYMEVPITIGAKPISPSSDEKTQKRKRFNAQSKRKKRCLAFR